MSEDILWEIVDLLDEGEVVYLHRETYDLLSHPDPTRWDGSEHSYRTDEVRNVVDVAPEQYVVLEPPEPKESFFIMEEFLSTVEDTDQKRVLNDALHSKKPFRYFRTAIEDMPIYDDWLDFKDAWMKVWVKDKLGAFLGTEEID